MLMRTTIEMPDHLLQRAKSEAALCGMSLREFFISAVELRLAGVQPKGRRRLPAIGDAQNGPAMGVLSGEGMDDALFG